MTAITILQQLVSVPPLPRLCWEGYFMHTFIAVMTISISILLPSSSPIYLTKHGLSRIPLSAPLLAFLSVLRTQTEIEPEVRVRTKTPKK